MNIKAFFAKHPYSSVATEGFVLGALNIALHYGVNHNNSSKAPSEEVQKALSTGAKLKAFGECSAAKILTNEASAFSGYFIHQPIANLAGKYIDNKVVQKVIAYGADAVVGAGIGYVSTKFIFDTLIHNTTQSMAVDVICNAISALVGGDLSGYTENVDAIMMSNEAYQAIIQH